jgi:hypothetical protein
MTPDRFWAQVERRDPDECWPWQGRRMPHGYGTLHHPGRRTSYAHRVAWEFTNGAIPDGLIVMHTCDNPPCANPRHLRVGTMRDNMQDREAKGRGRWGSNPPGIYHGVCRRKATT